MSKVLLNVWIIIVMLGTPVFAQEQVSNWKPLGEFQATAYCSCKLCCGKTDGITASGVKAHKGIIACNWLPFGTRLKYAPRGYNSLEMANSKVAIGTVLDRGAKSLFGTKSNLIKHIDLWMPTHQEALEWGNKRVNVWVQSAP